MTTPFVLSNKRKYDTSREVVRDYLLPLIGLPGIKLPNKRLYTRVFELYTSLNIDYIEAFHVALIESRKGRELFSYDRDFDGIPGITRREP